MDRGKGSFFDSANNKELLLSVPKNFRNIYHTRMPGSIGSSLSDVLETACP